MDNIPKYAETDRFLVPTYIRQKVIFNFFVFSRVPYFFGCSKSDEIYSMSLYILRLS